MRIMDTSFAVFGFIAFTQKVIMDFSGCESTAVGKTSSISAMMCNMLSEAPIGIDYFMFMAQVRMGTSWKLELSY